MTPAQFFYDSCRCLFNSYSTTVGVESHIRRELKAWSWTRTLDVPDVFGAWYSDKFKPFKSEYERHARRQLLYKSDLKEITKLTIIDTRTGWRIGDTTGAWSVKEIDASAHYIIISEWDDKSEVAEGVSQSAFYHFNRRPNQPGYRVVQVYNGNYRESWWYRKTLTTAIRAAQSFYEDACCLTDLYHFIIFNPSGQRVARVDQNQVQLLR